MSLTAILANVTQRALGKTKIFFSPSGVYGHYLAAAVQSAFARAQPRKIEKFREIDQTFGHVNAQQEQLEQGMETCGQQMTKQNAENNDNSQALVEGRRGDPADKLAKRPRGESSGF